MNEAILVTGDAIGSPDEKLGGILLSNFLRLLGNREQLPKYIILLNAGVKSAARDSENLDFLKKLEERGVDIISCQTCVDYFGIEDQIAAGRIDGMVNIEEILLTHNSLTI
ncbi:MAG: DsrE family protein [Armatimonadota bacterium]|nr:DsrE family protein [bacterium]